MHHAPSAAAVTTPPAAPPATPLATPLGPPGVLSIRRESVAIHATLQRPTFCSVESPLVLEELSRAVSDAPEAVRFLVIDLRAVSSINSTALGALVTVYTQALARGIRIALVGVSRQIRSLFASTRLDEVFRICTSDDDLRHLIDRD